ncbi:hormogonium polysaccharide biosynthesis glycosyltransferase HpsE [Laspinema olomoucense]|uniref:Hormogonium polysaccharide biosynthesis glycosyltransferase HpsE n=1 Tax=Laspinema olomoucense D3b TaxID=2953688 RepID=A0ABT2NC67_9CYAN|nr:MULTISPECIES: hormogonium polysaccharide biosynthesis glycosyltransferase HpsE [unclassified Laspinema]MCT7970473.1 hormogonium polysaccharide biosynthesis glycosyltransferase HpsE [Laspinema sp. D3d]MCT7980283.1 hormogonium polysaccharide biosynthesis glycosyltransferase HpsE [Laspinema sp. D3b]MCT7988529.1 hormogonium polysaccharide biosynthesis glycosyltransferase HpsE [Laspinema sp. D3a]
MNKRLYNLTVAIPTYNGAPRLPKVLEALRHQINPEKLAWEIIIIDNNSSDETAQVIKDYQSNWAEDFPLEYYFEGQQGLAFARERAIQEAQGTYVAFLDDDNIPAPDWIAAAYQFGINYPQAGAFSGQIHGEFEVQPPENFKQIAPFLAIRQHGSKPFLFDPDNLRLPPGAGLVVRKQAWREAVPKTPKVVGNQGDALARGDDYAPLLYLHKAGWEIWYNPAMHINHQIPHWRLERDYLLSLARACGLATCQLRMINATTREKPGIWVKTIFGNWRRIVQHRIKYGDRLKSELIPAFQMEFYRGSLMSSFYWLNKLKWGQAGAVDKAEGK